MLSSAEQRSEALQQALDEANAAAEKEKAALKAAKSSLEYERSRAEIAETEQTGRILFSESMAKEAARLERELAGANSATE